jgi:serine/threonine protein kinase
LADSQIPQIRIKDVKFIKMIADGGMGVVYKGTVNGHPVALKRIKFENMKPNTISAFCREIKIIR